MMWWLEATLISEEVLWAFTTVSYRLIEYLCHPLDEELKVLRSMEFAKEISKGILRRYAVRGFGNRIQNQHKQ